MTLRDAGYEIDLIDEPSAAQASVRAQAALRRGAHLMAAIGGDGTVHHALQVVAGTRTVLGIVPAGSGDDIARALGIARSDPTDALAALTRPRVKTVDLGRATPTGESGPSRWFGATLYAGFDAGVNRRANASSVPGPARYPIAVLGEIAALRSRPYVLMGHDGPDSTERFDAVTVVVANGSSYGGGMQISPDALIDDGLLDVTVVGSIARRTLLRVLPKVYRGTHTRHPQVSTRRMAELLLDAPGVVAYADGEYVGPLPLRVEAVPGALRVAVAAKGEIDGTP